MSKNNVQTFQNQLDIKDMLFNQRLLVEPRDLNKEKKDLSQENSFVFNSFLCFA